MQLARRYTRHDNEARSAELAGTALREMNWSALTRDGLLFLDSDLAIPDAPPERYRAYADAIRAE